MSDLKLTKESDGEDFNLTTGDRVTLTLPEIPTSGYRWHTVLTPEGPLTTEESHYAARSTTAVGGGGVRTLDFRASSPGRTRLEARLWRPWQGESSIIERFSATIVVKD